MTTRIVMIGCGNMGGALLARWARLDGLDFTVIDPADPEVPAGVAVKTSLDGLDEGSFDALIVAVKPQLIDKAIPPAAALIKTGGVAISIAAGTSAATVSNAAADAPAIRLMPNMPARIGQGVSGLYADPACSADHKALAEQLGEAVGTALWLADEDQVDRITAAAGSGPGYVFDFARAYQEAAEALGFDNDQARALVLQTIAGCMALAEETGQPFEDLRDSIMSKGGTTAAGVGVLNEGGEMDTRLRAALGAAYARALELRGD
ncbi:MAG: pyrroline-5-carboxylate reductase [Alphaproteobacteria bacterium]|nr:pyrroline-5-carboxylate reductase [Alphaproteobacteria bacterium]